MSEPTVWGWWHDEPGICNHLADYCGAACGRKSGEWKPLVKKSDFDAEVQRLRAALDQIASLGAGMIGSGADVEMGRIAAAALDGEGEE